MTQQKFYLNFQEDNGDIWKVTNELDTSTPYMEIDMETLLDFTEEQIMVVLLFVFVFVLLLLLLLLKYIEGMPINNNIN